MRSTQDARPFALDQLRERLRLVLRGKHEVIDHVICCLLARAHVLLEDMPGLGKTTLAKALAAAIGGSFSRLQCTPDLLPGDVTGFSVFNQKTREFEFRQGPVFADVLLVDEINRATPRTQSALLEAMAEGQVTVDNQRHDLSPTFFVIATQNPIEHAGTYPLPEAQLDRFGMRVRVGYPDVEHELAMLAAAAGGETPRTAELPPALFSTGDLADLQRRVVSVACEERVRRYLVQLGGASRSHPRVTLGISPRGLLIWQRLAQAHALLAGRLFVTPDDVQEVAPATLRVRLGVAADDVDDVMNDLLRSVGVVA